MTASRLISDLTADNPDVLVECLGECTLSVTDQLFLTLETGNEINHIPAAAVHVTVDTN